MLNQLNANLPVHLIGSPMVLPLLEQRVVAGFPSPAEDLGYKRIDLTQELITHPQATYLLTVDGDSLKNLGIFHGDVIVVNRALNAIHGDVVVAVIDNLFTVKQLYKRGGKVKLQAANPTYPDIVFREGETMTVWGVVTACIKRFRR